MIPSETLRRALTPYLWRLSDKNVLPSKSVRFAFRLKYSMAKKVQWNRIHIGRWQVFFESNKSKHWAIYTEEAHWLETTVSMDFKNIPIEIREHFEINNNASNLQHIYKIQTTLNTIFEIQLNTVVSTEQLVYNENGEMLGKMTLKQY